MSDFNIKKFLTETAKYGTPENPHRKLSYDEFTKGRTNRKFSQKDPSQLTGFEPEFQEKECIYCDGKGKVPYKGELITCTACDGKGGMVEGSMDAEYEGALNEIGVGQKESYFASVIAQDLIDSGAAPTSRENFDAIYDHYMAKYGNQNELLSPTFKDDVYNVFQRIYQTKGRTDFREGIFDRFKKQEEEIARQPTDREYARAVDELSTVSDFNIASIGVMDSSGEINVMDDNGDQWVIDGGQITFMGNEFSEGKELDTMLENAGMKTTGMLRETKPQGKAPGAQLKGKESIKGSGVKTYDEPHPASGRLVGEGEGEDKQWDSDWQTDGKFDFNKWSDYVDSIEDIGAKYRSGPDNPYGTDGSGFDDMYLDRDEELGVEEGRMPASVIRSKQKYANMTDEEFAELYGDRDEQNLRQMAWRHGYGKMSPHYWNRVQRAKGVKEEIVPYDKSETGEYLDNETGQIFQNDDIVYDKEESQYRELTRQEWENRDRARNPEKWAAQDEQDAADRAELAAWDAEDKAARLAAKQPRRLSAQAISMFGDIAGGGGDPMDYLNQQGWSYEEMDAEAEAQGYEDAYDWAQSFADMTGANESVEYIEKQLAESMYDEYDDEEDEEDWYGYDDERTRGPFIADDAPPAESYWRNNSPYQDKSDKLQDLIPAMGEVEDAENNPALEAFRELANVYYDVYNNGGYDQGYGQRYDELIAVSGWDEHGHYDVDDLEELANKVTLAAWEEQSAKGTLSENLSIKKTETPLLGLLRKLQRIVDSINSPEQIETAERYFMNAWDLASKREDWDLVIPEMEEIHDQLIQKKEAMMQGVTEDDDEDMDLMGKGEMDMGDETSVDTGDYVSISPELGAGTSAQVVAVRPNLIVVKLNNSKLKVLSDDQWWVEDEDDMGFDSDVVDVDYDDEEPEELQFEGKWKVMPAGSQDDRQRNFFKSKKKVSEERETEDGYRVEYLTDQILRILRKNEAKTFYALTKKYNGIEELQRYVEDLYAKTRDHATVYQTLKKEAQSAITGAVEEAGYRDYEHSHEDDKRYFKRQEMHHELGHENKLNNYGIFINGKFWKPVKTESHAKAIVNTLKKKGKDAFYRYGAYPLGESKYKNPKHGEPKEFHRGYDDAKAGKKKNKTLSKSKSEKGRQYNRGYEEALEEGRRSFKNDPRSNTVPIWALEPGGNEKTELVDQLVKAFPEDNPNDFYAWIKSAGEYGQPLTVEEYAEWRMMDDYGNMKEAKVPGNYAQMMSRKKKRAGSARAKLAKEIRAHDSSVPHKAIQYWLDNKDKYGWGETAEDFLDWLEYDEDGNFKEGKGTHRKGYDKKGGGYNKPGSPKQKKAASKAGRDNKKYMSRWADVEDKDVFEDEGSRKLVDLARGKVEIPVTVQGTPVSLIVKRRSLKIGKGPGMPVFDVFITAYGKKQAISRTNSADETIDTIVDRVNSHGGKPPIKFADSLNELEVPTATDQLAQDRQDQAVGDTQQSADEISTDDQIAGFQQIVKNMMAEPDNELEQSVQDITTGDEANADEELGIDDIVKLKALLGALNK